MIESERCGEVGDHEERWYHLRVALADEALLEAWRGGDAQAGAELFDRHFAAVSRFFRTKVGDGYEDDLIQATFLACVEGRERFSGQGSFRSYLYGIAYNMLREHVRLRRRHAAVADLGEVAAEDLAPRPSGLLARKTEERLLLEALRKIPLEHQTLLELYFWEPLGARQIGETMGLPEGTVRTRIRRAKELLARELARLSGQPLESTVTRLEQWAKQVRPETLLG
jgi:RNA polymerase sigma factor (sigma-70 family)